jgi:hypothetical protein
VLTLMRLVTELFLTTTLILTFLSLADWYSMVFIPSKVPLVSFTRVQTYRLHPYEHLFAALSLHLNEVRV